MSHDSSLQSLPPTDDGTASTSATVDQDTVFDVLSHNYRRRALSYLLQNGRSASIDDLHDHLASDVESLDDEPDARRRIDTAVHHCHRPKLEEAGLVEYDEENDVVRATAAATDLEPHLEFDE